MVRLFVVLGFALLAGGAYAIVDGWPYRVLERGFTEVILGGLSLVGGLILLALAAVLAEVRRLKGLVSGAMAAVALSEPHPAEPRPAGRPALNEEFPRGEPAPEKASENAPIPEAGHGGRAATLAAGAGAAVVAGALAGLAKSEDAPDVKATDRTDETADEVDTAGEGDGAHSDRLEAVAAEPSQAPSAAAGEIDDWLLPSASPERDAAPSDVPPDERGDSDEADAKTEESRDESEHPFMAGKVDSAAATIDETEARSADDEFGAAKPETAPASSAGDELWWPRIDRPAREESASVDDEFNALRDQLAGVVNAPEVEPPRRDRDDKDTAESWTAPRPWPPVTQPRDPGALSEVEAEAGDKAPPEDAESEPAAPVDEPSLSESWLSEPELAAEPAPTAVDASPVEKAERSAADTEAADAKPDEAKPDEAKPDEEPAASEEGVIGAYQVGETQFTMFADGSIHARTPDGDYTFASMEELKAYLASEKDKLGPGAS